MSADAWEALRQWGGPTLLLTILGWAWARLSAWRKARVLESSALRVLVDAQAHLLDAVARLGREDLPITLQEELAIQERFVRTKRRELWRVDGHAGKADAEEASDAKQAQVDQAADTAAKKAVMQWATRTQRIEAFKAQRDQQPTGGDPAR